MTEREELESLRQQQGPMSERQELDMLRQSQGVQPPDTLGAMRLEPQVQPAVSTAVSPEFAQAPAPEEMPSFGIIPRGTTEKVLSAIAGPQQSMLGESHSYQAYGMPHTVTSELSTLEKVKRTAANLALGAQKFIPGQVLGALEDPYRVPEALARFVPEVGRKIRTASPIGTVLNTEFDPRVGGKLFVKPSGEERKKARKELMEDPFEAALLLAPSLKKIKAPKPKPVAAPVVEVAKIKKTGKDYNITEGQSFINAEIVGNSLLIKSSHVPSALRRKGVYSGLLENLLRKAKKDHPRLEYFEGNVIGPEAEAAARRWKSTKELLPKETPPLLRTRIDEVLKDYSGLVKKAPLLVGEKGKVVGKKEVLGEKPIKGQPKIIGLNKAEVERIRRHTELDKLPDAQKRTFVETLERAKADKLDESALETADHVLKAKKQITDAEHAGMVIKAAKLADEYDAVVKNASGYLEKGNKAAAQMERSRAEAVIDQLDKLTEATKSGRREVARTLSIGRMMINRESYDLAHVIQRARVAKGGKLTPKETARIESLVAEHAKLEKRIAILEQKGATPSQIERARVLLEMQKKKIRGDIERVVPWTPRRVFGETVNTLRTLKATADMSGVLRQGLVLSVTRPKLAAKSFGKAFVATFSKHKSEQIDFAIRRMDQHYLRERAGLHLSEFGEGSRLTMREEYFMAQMIERVPVVGEIVKASNRNMATFLNLMRVGAFDQFLLKYPNASRVELKAWADWVNIASGRGNLGRAKAIANELALVVFAPRFAISRVQTPFMMLKYLKHPYVRKEIAKDLVGLVGLGTTALSLAALSGFDVGLNPREADFGKIRVEDTRIDMWAGIQQPARLIARIGVATTDRVGISGKQLADSEKDFDPVQAVGRFAGYKLAPSITLPRELMTGETMVGEPRTPLKTAAYAVMPMVYEDIADAYRVGGTPRAGLSAGLSFFGVSVNTYGDTKSRVRRDIKSAMRKGNFTEARTRAYQWNMEHPDKRIHSVRTATDTLNIVTGRPRSRGRQRPAARR